MGKTHVSYPSGLVGVLIIAWFQTALRGVFRRAIAFELADGRKFWLSGMYDGVEAMIEAIENRTTPLTLADSRESIRRTGAAAFGPITVRPDGLIVDNKKITWRHIEYAGLQSGIGKFVIKLHGVPEPWYSVKDTTVPNASACMHLMVELKQAEHATRPIDESTASA
ncbi:MAG: hypothetical protein GC159_05440 [Phycisphaera sp.]|nr:hypothetical protein [Phycisphaera sp.]